MSMIETRSIIEVPSIEGNTLVGYAAKYGVLSYPMYEPRLNRDICEVLHRGCFDRTLGGDHLGGLTDVTCHYAHDKQYILGRTSSGTLTLVSDEIGLRYRDELPSHDRGQMVAEMVQRGDIKGCSFGMVIRKHEWDLTGDLPTRHIYDADLIEISFVVNPQYPDTEVALRSLAEAEAEIIRQEQEHRSYLLADAKSYANRIELIQKSIL